MSCNTPFDLCVNQYASYQLSCQLTDASNAPLDITNWEFSGSIKSSYKDSTSLVNFTIEKILPESGSFNAYLNDDQTALLVKAQYYYDIVAQISGSDPPTTYRVLEGTVSVDPGVTQI